MSMFGSQRSERATEADVLAEKLVTQRQRVFAGTLWFVITFEVVFWYFDVGLWLRLLVPVLWIGFLIHNNALLVLHELWEINDQLAGRKDELRRLFAERG